MRAQQHLNGALTNSATSVVVTSNNSTDLGATQNVGDVISIAGELMLVGNISTNTLTVTRGHGGTTAVAHASGELVRLVVGNATCNRRHSKSSEWQRISV